MTEVDDVASLTVSIENIGGIRSCQLTLDRGVSVLTGRNATNRTSFLRAVGAAVGGSSGELKADADAGSVTLELGDEQYTRTFEREGQAVRTGGDPFVADGTLVDNYCCLLADNPARDAVERGDADALREFIMSPVDTGEIRATVERTQQSIRSLESDLEEAERAGERLSELEEKREARRAEREEVESELQSVRETIAEYEADADEAREAEAVVEDLAEAREEHERVQDSIETQRNALDALRVERADVEAELSETSAPEAERAQIEAEIERLQRRERELENDVNDLLSIVEFNEGLLEESGVPGVDDPDDGPVFEELDPDTQRVECWTCGTRVERGAIEDRLDSLRDVIDEKRRERNEVRTEVDDLRSDLEEVRSAVRHRESLAAQLEDIDSEIEERESRVETLSERRSELADRIDDLEAAAAESDDLRDSDLLERYQRLSELEYERGQLEERIDSLEAELETVRERAGRVESLESDLDDRRAELAAARTRIEDLEERAVETFNEQVATVLDLLDYGNVERVWIERKGGMDAAGPVPESSFELHIVRSTDSDAVYEDTVDHLSESEREVLGLVVALAGYLVHDVHESVPVMLLDSLEAIDADRIAALVEYFADFVPFLVVALLPEDAAALPGRYDEVRMGHASR